MRRTTRLKHLGWAAALVACAAFAADAHKEFRYTVGPGATLNVVNQAGSVTIHPSNSRQVIISTTAHSDKVEVDSSQTGNRIEAQTHMRGNPSDEEARVDYDIQVPADILLSVRADGGPIRVEKLRSDMTLEGSNAAFTLQDCNNSHVHIHAIKGPVTITNLGNGHVEITSLNGDVQLTSVSGPKVSINTTKGHIHYVGDFNGGGDYLFSSHSGDIDVSLPATASVDLSALSIAGSVEQDFPLQQKSSLGFQASPGRSFAGTSNTGASSVQLRSYSGKIRVKKQ
jgi:DUF4097 and DUF4098 domain-containing protein YvlB